MYVRKVKKGAKTYLYYYKSQRIGNKVKSIYVSKVIQKPKKLVKKEIKLVKNTEIVNKLIEFDNLIFEINKLITIKDLKNSINIYSKMLEVYSNLDINFEDKQKLFNKLNSAYNDLLNLSKEYKIKVE